jgi:hypothetical protein
VVRPPRIVVALLLAGLAMTACASGAKQAAAPGSGSAATASATAPSSSGVSTSGASTSGVDPNAPDSGGVGDIPDNQAFVAFMFSPGAYTVKVPEGWSRSDATDGTVQFTDHFNAIELRVAPADAMPSERSAIDTEVPQVQSSTPGFELHNVTTVRRNAGSAVLLAYHATSAPNEVTGKSVTLSVERYEFWQGGNEAILTLSGPLNADNVDPWRTVTDSFAWT